jgi:hypothetical protein
MWMLHASLQHASPFARRRHRSWPVMRLKVHEQTARSISKSDVP